MADENVTKNRHKYVGGSDLPTILGLNAKYNKSIYDFAREKAGILPNTFKGNEYTEYGNLMEPVIRDYINSVYGVNYHADTVIDTVRNYRGNTDGIDRDADIPILEIKTFGDELDVEYYAPQCQFYMETFDKDACLLVGYQRPKDFYTGVDFELENDKSYFNLEFDENRIVTHTIYRDEKVWSEIEKRILAFKKAVEMLKENKETTEDEFNQVFFGSDLVAMTNKVATLETQLLSLKSVEDEYKKAKEELYKIFEEKGIISFDTGTMKITKVAPTSYDTVSIDSKKLQAEEPAIYDKYKTVKTTNRKGYILITSKEDKWNLK